jgi:hypothetical protein
MFTKKAKLLGIGSSKYEQDLVSIYYDEEDAVECLFYDCDEAELHPDAAPDGGVLCTDASVMERQKSAVVDIMKSLGKKLLTGKFDLLKISLPVKIFEPRSYLQKLCDPLVFTDLMGRAASAETPEERLRWVATYFVAGYHRAFLTWSKPFNPILGETWNAELPDGSRAFMEQISHHPPISAYQIMGPGRSYHFFGHSQPSVAYKTNGITTYAIGERQVEFLDGTVIDVSFPEYNIRNLVSSSTTKADVSGVVEFNDVANGLSVTLKIGSVEGHTRGLLGRPDGISGAMYRTSNASQSPGMRRSMSTSRHLKHHHQRMLSKATSSGNLHAPISFCQGNWLSHLDWDEERYWTLSETKVHEWAQIESEKFPSDCSNREDLSALLNGDMDRSQEAKDQMENQQRQDAKLRPVPT